MRVIGRFLVRGLIILGAYLLASMVATFALTIGLAKDQDVFLLGMVYGTLFVTLATALPAILVVGLAETLRVRSAYFYAGTGLLIAIIMGMAFFFPAWDELSSPTASFFRITDPVGFLFVCGLSGLIAGLTYWGAAGRYAGVWRDLKIREGS